MSVFTKKTVPQLSLFLRERGIQVTGKHKKELIALCEASDKASLPVNPDLQENSEESRKAYLKKLDNHGVTDPFSILDKFKDINDTRDLPVVGLYDIFNYLLDSRADYDRKKLKAYKSAEDYRLFADGHVEKLMSFDNDTSDNVSIVSHVKPTQRTLTYLHKKFYMLWVLLSKDGSIQSAYCECKGGSDGACRHVAATLYDLESHCDRIKTCTDVPMPWVRKGHQDDQPTRIKQLKIASVEYGNSSKNSDSGTSGHFTDVRLPADRKNPTQSDLDDFCRGLRQIDSNACCLPMTEPPSINNQGEYTAYSTLSQRAKDLSVTATIQNFLGSLEPGEYDTAELWEHFVTDYCLKPDERCEVELLTTAQSHCQDWHHIRKDRMTASEMHRIQTRLCTLSKDPTADPGPLLKSLTTTSDLGHISAIQWGIKQEPKAKKRYAIVEKKRHRGLLVKESGLWVSEQNPLFACSPDGIVSCKCKISHPGRGNQWLIEVKCPAKGKDLPAKEAAEKYCGVKANGTLDSTHKYYVQIQCQLGIVGLQMCDLVVFTKKGVTVIEVPYDENTFSNIASAAHRFGGKYLFPFLLENLQNESVS